MITCDIFCASGSLSHTDEPPAKQIQKFNGMCFQP